MKEFNTKVSINTLARGDINGLLTVKVNLKFITKNLLLIY